jgi:hypothetical protein
LAAQAKDSARLADQIAQRVRAQTYDRNLTATLLHEIADDGATISMEGERAAEQATMALDSLSLAYVKNEHIANETELRAAITDLFQQLDNPSAYNAPRFAMQMEKIAALVPRRQPRSSGGH